MPELTPLDATQAMPQLAHAVNRLDQFREATQQYAALIVETTALKGEIRERLVHNAEQIAASGDRIHAWVSEHIDGIRQGIEHGANTAANSAEKSSSITIPYLL